MTSRQTQGTAGRYDIRSTARRGGGTVVERLLYGNELRDDRLCRSFRGCVLLERRIALGRCGGRRRRRWRDCRTRGGWHLPRVHTPEPKIVKNRVHLGCSVARLAELDAEVERLRTLGVDRVGGRLPAGDREPLSQCGDARRRGQRVLPEWRLLADDDLVGSDGSSSLRDFQRRPHRPHPQPGSARLRRDVRVQ